MLLCVKFLNSTVFTDPSSPALTSNTTIYTPAHHQQPELQKKNSIVMTTHDAKQTQTISVTSTDDDEINAEHAEAVVLL